MPVSGDRGPGLTWSPGQGGIELDAGALPLEVAPVINRGFSESIPTTIQWSGPPGVSFFIDDEEPPRLGASAWCWTPGFYAGQVRAELLSAEGKELGRYLLDVSPDPRKVGGDFFRSMLDELWAYDPSLVLGTEPATAAGDLGPHEDPVVAYERLRRHGPEFVKALEEVSRCPRSALQSVRRELAPQQVRRIDRTTARLLVARSDIFAELQDMAAVRARREGRLKLNVSVTERTFDGPANRCMVDLLRRVLHRLRAVFIGLEALMSKETEEEARTSLAARWPRRKHTLQTLQCRLKRIGLLSPFKDVTRPETTPAGLNAVSGDPLYALAYQRGWQSIRRGVAGTPSDERLWLSPTWEVFERWSYLKLVDAVKARFPQARWRRIESAGVGARDQWKGEWGEDGMVDVFLQPSFPGTRAPARFRSISTERQPDMVCSVSYEGRKLLLVFDAKYRTSSASVKEAMASAHIYHDALRWGDLRPERALLVVPRTQNAGHLADAAFHREHGVGVLDVNGLQGQEWMTLLPP